MVGGPGLFNAIQIIIKVGLSITIKELIIHKIFANNENSQTEALPIKLYECTVHAAHKNSTCTPSSGHNTVHCNVNVHCKDRSAFIHMVCSAL